MSKPNPILHRIFGIAGEFLRDTSPEALKLKKALIGQIKCFWCDEPALDGSLVCQHHANITKAVRERLTE
jgi:hypothetical protein